MINLHVLLFFNYETYLHKIKPISLLYKQKITSSYTSINNIILSKNFYTEFKICVQ